MGEAAEAPAPAPSKGVHFEAPAGAVTSASVSAAAAAPASGGSAAELLAKAQALAAKDSKDGKEGKEKDKEKDAKEGAPKDGDGKKVHIKVAAHSKQPSRGGGQKPSAAALARFGSRKQFKLEDAYDLKAGCELGSGATASVKLCVHRATKTEYAVKCIRKQQTGFDAQQFQNEISIM